MGPARPLLSLFLSFVQNSWHLTNIQCKFWRWLDSNCRRLVTALPTGPQRLPSNICFSFLLIWWSFCVVVVVVVVAVKSWKMKRGVFLTKENRTEDPFKSFSMMSSFLLCALSHLTDEDHVQRPCTILWVLWAPCK